MKTDVKNEYTKFHLNKESKHNYPTEWVIRTMLGNYPELTLDRSKYPGGNILDLGFGDGRNMQLLNNCGLNISGVEITEETCTLVTEKLKKINIAADLRVGTNTKIPFDNDMFDYVLASSSCYYVDSGTTFKDNLNEISRVLRKGGYLVANFPVFTPDIKMIEESFILKDCKHTEDGHIIIHNDIYGIRNGYKFKAFGDEQDLKESLSVQFEDICIGKLYDHYYGVQINTLIVTCRKN